MTYNVFSGTLNPTQSLNRLLAELYVIYQWSTTVDQLINRHFLINNIYHTF